MTDPPSAPPPEAVPPATSEPVAAPPMFELVQAPTPAPRLDRLLGALLLAADKPLSVEAVATLVNTAVEDEAWPTAVTVPEVHAAVLRLASRWRSDEGFELVESGGGWRVRTAPDLSAMIRRLWPERAVRLGKAALETLSVVAYRQPCTRTEVEEIRGVDCGGLLRTLLDRRLVQIIGRKDEVGRPLLYGTTAEFLEVFALTDLRGLPTLRDLESMQTEDAVRARGAEAMHGAALDPAELEPAELDPADLEPAEGIQTEAIEIADDSEGLPETEAQTSAQSPAASSPATPMDPTRADT